MIYHIVTGDLAAAPLMEAIVSEPLMAGEVVVIKDVLSVGPLLRQEGQKFPELRTAFWQQVLINEKNPVVVDDLERLLKVGNELSKNETAQIWLWVAPWPADMCTYHWALKYLGKYLGRLFVVNIAGLPFLDEQGKLFFPKGIGEIVPRELIKARKLARPVSAPELETDVYEWGKLTDENAGIRIHEGGKRLKSVSEEYYDAQLLGFCTGQYQKASKVVNQALAKFNIPTGDVYLGWRLRKLAEAGKLQLQGEINKSLKDFEVKFPGGDAIDAPESGEA